MKIYLKKIIFKWLFLNVTILSCIDLILRFFLILKKDFNISLIVFWKFLLIFFFIIETKVKIVIKTILKMKILEKIIYIKIKKLILLIKIFKKLTTNLLSIKFIKNF